MDPLEPLLDLQTDWHLLDLQRGGHTWKMAITYQSLRPTAQAPAMVVLYLPLHLRRLHLEELLGVKILSGRRSISLPAWRSWQLPPPGMLLPM